MKPNPNGEAQGMCRCPAVLCGESAGEVQHLRGRRRRAVERRPEAAYRHRARPATWRWGLGVGGWNLGHLGIWGKYRKG